MVLSWLKNKMFGASDTTAVDTSVKKPSTSIKAKNAGKTPAPPKTAMKYTTSMKSLPPSPHRLLNNKLSFDEAKAFYHGLAPTSRNNLKKSLQVTHNNKPYISMRKLYVGPSALPPVAEHGGRGVFAGETFKKGDVVEICPMLLDRDEMWRPRNEDAKVLPAHEYYTISWLPDWFAVEEKGMTRSGKLKKEVQTSRGPWQPKDWQPKTAETDGDEASGSGSGSSSNSATTAPTTPSTETPSTETKQVKEYKAPTSHFTYVNCTEAEKKKSPYNIQMSGIMLGYGSLYNHARKNSNVCWKFGADATIEFIATRDIEEGEELLVDYGDEYWVDELGFVPDS